MWWLWWVKEFTGLEQRGGRRGPPTMAPRAVSN